MEVRIRTGEKGEISQLNALRLKKLLKPVILAFGGVFVLTSAAFAVEAPYTDNFDYYPGGSMPNNFSTQTKGSFFSSQWSIQNPSGTSGVYEHFDYGDDVLASAAVNVTNLADGDFLLSTSFVLNSYSVPPTSADIRVGLVAHGSDSDFSSGYQFSYVVFENGRSGGITGGLQMYRAGLLLSGSTTGILPVSFGTTYTMTLRGSYSPNGLSFAGTLTDGSNSILLTATDPTPLPGSYFGYYDFTSGVTNHAASLRVSYDNFSITVPEPGIAWLVGFGIAVGGICNVSGQRIQRVLERIGARIMTTRSAAARVLASDSDASGRRAR